MRIYVSEGSIRNSGHPNISYQYGTSGTALIWHTALPELHSSHSYFSNNIWSSQAEQPFFSIESSQGTTMISDYDLFYSPSGGKAPSGSGIL